MGEDSKEGLRKVLHANTTQTEHTNPFLLLLHNQALLCLCWCQALLVWVLSSLLCLFVFVVLWLVGGCVAHNNT